MTHYKLLYMLVVTSLLLGCTENINQSNQIYYTQQSSDYDGQSALYNIPMLSKDQLNEIAVDNDYLNYKEARQFAYTEFISNIDIFYSEYTEEIKFALSANIELPLTLTNRPAVVFNYDEKPYYYEFGILHNGTLIGTLVALASPVEKQVIIDRIFTEPLDYNSYAFNYNRYIGNYPEVYYGLSSNNLYQQIITQNGSLELTSITLNSSSNEFNFTDFYPNEDLDSMSREFKENVGMPYKEYLDIINDSLSTVKAWWLERTNPFEFYLGGGNISENFNVPTNQRDVISEALNNNDYTDKFFLQNYLNNSLLNTVWSGACGPTIMSWLYRGKYDSYYGVYIPLCGEVHPHNNNKPIGQFFYNYNVKPRYSKKDIYDISHKLDNRLYYQWFKRTDSLCGGDALYHLGLSRGLREATDELYNVNFITLDQAISLMKTTNEPVVIVCGTKAGPHYIGAIGMGYIINKKGKKGHSYFYYMDNGYKTRDENNRYPCWKKTNGWNLHYIWKRQF
ncbi:MAG: hypothetical protein ACI35S_08415 [Anaeroplasma sp.]